MCTKYLQLYATIIAVLILFVSSSAIVNSTTLYARLQKLKVKQPDGLRLPTYTDWSNIPPYLQSVLISIDDKLRSLDTFSHTLRLAKLDYSLDQLVRRLDNIETKLGTLQAKVDMRIDKVKEVVIAKDIKEDLTNNHISRSINDLVDKLNNKFIFMNAKLDLVSERVVNNIGQMERNLQTSHDEVLEKLSKIEERQERIETEEKVQSEKVNHIKVEVNRVKMLVKDDVMSLLVIKTDELRESISSGLEEISEQEGQAVRGINDMKRKFELLQQIPHQVNKTVHKVTNTMKRALNQTLQSRCYADDRGRGIQPQDSSYFIQNISSTVEKQSENRRQQLNALDTQLDHFMRKVYNGIQGLWQSSDITKTKLEEMLSEGNKTRDYLKTQFSSIRNEMTPVSSIRPQVAKFQNTVANHLEQLSESVDKSFETMLTAQNHFIDSCQDMMKIQEELPTITLVLHSMLIEIRNKSEVTQLRDFVQKSNVDIAASLTRLHETIVSFHEGENANDQIQESGSNSTKCSTEDC